MSSPSSAIKKHHGHPCASGLCQSNSSCGRVSLFNQRTSQRHAPMTGPDRAAPAPDQKSLSPCHSPAQSRLTSLLTQIAATTHCPRRRASPPGIGFQVEAANHGTRPTARPSDVTTATAVQSHMTDQRPLDRGEKTASPSSENSGQLVEHDLPRQRFGERGRLRSIDVKAQACSSSQMTRSKNCRCLISGAQTRKARIIEIDGIAYQEGSDWLQRNCCQSRAFLKLKAGGVFYVCLLEY